jgi:hypothetical protein
MAQRNVQSRASIPPPSPAMLAALRRIAAADVVAYRVGYAAHPNEGSFIPRGTVEGLYRRHLVDVVGKNPTRLAVSKFGRFLLADAEPVGAAA